MLKALNAFQDNYIWVLGAPGARVVVDPGDADVLFAEFQQDIPAAILITHHHPDHTAGLDAAHARWPEVPIYAPQEARIRIATHRVAGGDSVIAAGMQFDVLAVPGHTLSHIAYVGMNHLFCGDTLFSLGCGRLFEGSPVQMLASLDAIAELPAVTRVCCAHEYTLANARFAREADPGNADLAAYVVQVAALREAGRPSLPSSIELEKACNPFLRVDTPGVRRILEARFPEMEATREARFAALRTWKDGYR